jgi:hypothetical protein
VAFGRGLRVRLRIGKWTRSVEGRGFPNTSRRS